MEKIHEDGVKAPQHFKTPRSHLLLRLVALLLVLGRALRFQLLDVRQVLLHVREHLLLLDDAGLRGVWGSWRGPGGLCEVVSDQR